MTNIVKGVEALVEDDQLLKVDLNHIHPSPLNPRKSFPQKEIDELAKSIQTEGLIKSILVRRSKEKEGCFEIVDGDRRFRALTRLEWKDPVPVILRNLSDEQTVSIMLVDNIQKAMLSPLEEAAAFLTLIGFGETREEIANKTGKSVSHVDKRLKLNSMIPAIKKMFEKDLFSTAAALIFARETEENQKKLAEHYSYLDRFAIDIDGKLSPDDLRYYIEENLHLNLKEAPFDIKTRDIFPAAGACTECPKCTITKSTLFDDLNDAQCQDGVCYKKKLDLHVKLTLTKKGDKIKKLSTMAGGKDKEAFYVDEFNVCPDQKNPPKNAQKGIVIGGPKSWMHNDLKKGDVVYFTKKKKERETTSRAAEKKAKEPTPKDILERELRNMKNIGLAIDFVKEALKKNWTKKEMFALAENLVNEACDAAWMEWWFILDVYDIPYTDESVENDEENKKAVLKKCKTLDDYMKLLQVIDLSYKADNLDSDYEPNSALALKEFTTFAKDHKVNIAKVKKDVDAQVKALRKFRLAKMKEDETKEEKDLKKKK